MYHSTRDNAQEKQNSNRGSQQSLPAATAQFVDSRTTTAAQLQQQAVMASSPTIAAQRMLMNTMSGASVQQQKTIQCAAPEEELQMKTIANPAQLAGLEEEPLQGKFTTVQRAEDEELLQGKFETAQRMEEEEPLQGKFQTAQLAALEEEPLQGKFTTVQRAEDEELLQGKFETAQCIEEEETLQGKFEPVQRAEDEELLQGKFAPTLVQREEKSVQTPNNTGLPDQLKSGIESLSGMSMDHVKVHYNSSEPAQLNAHAYAQGSEIHVAPGQEQHLPHEAWHVVQQAQGRVKPTMQMKAGVPVNDDVGLETEADVMGAKALGVGESSAMQLMTSNTSENVLHKGALSASTVQRLTTQNGYRFPANERNNIDNFLDENGYTVPFVCSLANYNLLVARYAALAGQITATQEVSFNSAPGRAYEAVVDFAQSIELTVDSADWIAARDRAVVAYETTPAMGAAAAALAEWPGRGAMPATFTASVTQEIAAQAILRAQAIEAAYQAYINNNRLNAGTINAIKLAIPGADLAAVTLRLGVVYQRQCTITRLNWVQHLGIAGANTNPPGSPPVHYTKFNDALAPAGDITGLRVDQNTVDQLCDELFINHVAAGEQLHATVVVGGHRYHRYWDGHYGNSVGAPAASQATNTTLDREYDRMHLEISDLVTAAKNRHGRVSHNNNGQQTIANVGP